MSKSQQFIRERGRTRHQVFNQKHRNLPSFCYAIDIDLLLLDGEKILAVLEYKPGGQDHVTYTQCVAFNNFIDMEIPVFIVEGYNVEEGHFTIKRFKYAEWDENMERFSIRSELEIVVLNWKEYENWEKELRKKLS